VAFPPPPPTPMTLILARATGSSSNSRSAMKVPPRSSILSRRWGGSNFLQENFTDRSEDLAEPAFHAPPHARLGGAGELGDAGLFDPVEHQPHAGRVRGRLHHIDQPADAFGNP